MSLFLNRFLAVLVIAFAAAGAPAVAQQHGDKEYQPSVGQEGKDVIWVPTPNELIAKMLDMAKLTPKDIHFDLGSGDGRTVIAAAKHDFSGFYAQEIAYRREMGYPPFRRLARIVLSDAGDDRARAEAENAAQVVLFATRFTPARKDNMIAWMAARCDEPNYGKVLVFAASGISTAIPPVSRRCRRRVRRSACRTPTSSGSRC